MTQSRSSAIDLPGPAPASLEAERAILGAVLLDPGNLPRVLGLLERDELSKDGHRAIYGAMVRLFERSAPADVLTVAEELRRTGELEAVGGPAALSTMMEEATVATQLGAYAQIVREKAQLRELIQRSREFAEAGFKDGGDVDTPLERLLQIHAARTNGHRPQGPTWPLHDGADAWGFPDVAELVESLLSASGIVWWGGLPKRFKSLFCLYVCLAIACRRSHVAKRFLIRAFPKILYVAREDGGPRLQARRDDILSAWAERPESGAIRFVIRPHLDLLNPEHVGWLRQTCLRESITLLVLDTWTALSPTADPLGAKDQAQLAAVVVKLCEEINGLVVVVDHSRKNRPDGQPLSSADIFGPPQKWAAAEHIVMLDLTADGRRLEVFVEGKDVESRRFFLTVSPRGSGAEKFAYAGTADELADRQRAVGNANREVVHQTLLAAGQPLSTQQLTDALAAASLGLKRDTVQAHLSALVEAGRARRTGNGPGTRYYGLSVSREAPSTEIPGTEDE